MNVGIFKFVILLSVVFVASLFVPSSMAVSESTMEAYVVEGGACGKCGDGYCNKRCGETSTSCPKDCAVSSDSYQLACARCGDGVCARSCENERSCPRDCASESRSILASIGD